jgi:hypothetical protein
LLQDVNSMHSSTAIAKILSNILTFLFIKVKHTYTKKSVRYDGVIVSNGTQCSIINSRNRLKNGTCGQSTIEQTPNARDGYLIAFVAGLLTCSSSPRLPGLTSSGLLRLLFVGTYSSRYCTGLSPDSLLIPSRLNPSRSYNDTKIKLLQL